MLAPRATASLLRGGLGVIGKYGGPGVASVVGGVGAAHRAPATDGIGDAGDRGGMAGGHGHVPKGFAVAAGPA